MDEVWMLDYLDGVIPRLGVFESEQAAWNWVVVNDSSRTAFYTPFKLTINREAARFVPTNAPNSRYVNRR